MVSIDTRQGKEKVTFRVFEVKSLQMTVGILGAVVHLDPRIAEALNILGRIVDGQLGPRGFGDTCDELSERNYQGSDRNPVLDQTPAE